MNTGSHSPLYRRIVLPPFLARRLLLTACWLAGSLAVHAIDSALIRSTWKLKYGVLDSQINDSLWLAKDNDGDGLKNSDEIAAGTNPFDAKKTIGVKSIIKNGSLVDLTFPTELGKLYQVQFTTTLNNAGSWALHATPVQKIGDGNEMTLSPPYLANSFYRILVTDFDTDNDGLSDWLEQAVSLDKNLTQTVAGTDDYTYVSQQVALPNVVTINAAEPFASEDGPAAGRLTVSRTQTLFPLSLSYNVAGTALPNTDYNPLAGTVDFSGRSASADIFVNPKVQSTVKGGRSVTATLAADTGNHFSLGSPNAATVIINGSTAATGTGLLARYYDTASSTYLDAANFGQAGAYFFVRGTPTTTGTIVVTYIGPTLSALAVGNQVKLSYTTGSLSSTLYNNLICPVTAVTANTFTVSITAASAFSVSTTNGNCSFSVQSFTHPAVVERVDPTVNFDWQYGTPNGVTISPLNPVDNYSASWECYLNPTTAGSYIFQLDADDKAEVLLDTGSGLTQIVEHNWNTPGSDAVGTFKVSAPITLAVPAAPAQRYRMVVHHVETTGDARCRLQWKVPGSTSFANIPQANQYTHTQATSYSYSGGNLVVTPTGGHSYSVGNTVQLAFSTGVLFTPGVANTYNGTYTITAVGGTFPTNTFTVAVTGFPISVPGAKSTAGSPTIIVPSIAGLATGMAVSGTGLPASEFITAIAPGLISVTTGTGVTAQSSTTLTATLPPSGTVTGSGLVLNNTSSSTTGLYNLCYANTAFSGSPARVGVDAAVTTGNNGLWLSGTPDATLIQPDTFSVRWSGQVQPQFSEDYTFVVQSDDGCTLSINGQKQTLMPAPSSSVGGSSNSVYNSATGEVVFNYSTLAVAPGSFQLGETVRLDPTSGNLSHAPTTAPTYTYDGTTGLAVIDYTNLIVGSPGGTVVAGSFAVGESIELDPTSGSLSPLSTVAYPITAVSGNTFTVDFGTGVYLTGTGNITVADTRNAVITKLYASGTYSYNTSTGLAVVDYSSLANVPAGSFPANSSIELVPASGNLNGTLSTSYNVTATTGSTFTVSFGAGAAATGTGTMNIAAPAGGPIPQSQTSGFAFTMGTGKYANASLGNMSVDIINKPLKDWSSMGNERFVRIPMIGGVRYDIQLDYYESSSAARCFLSWYSPSQTKQIIPSERLYPTNVPQAPPSHISPTAATALAGGNFSYQVAGSNGAAVSVSGNPAWLTYSNGVLSGTPPPGAAGDYQIVITTNNSSGTGTSVLNLHVDANAGTVPREYWNNVAGNSISSIPIDTPPTGTASLSTLEAPSNSGSNFGARIRGFITAPVTGNYYFWLAANNSAELWISNDDEPVEIFRRASVTTGSATAKNWVNEPGQKSPWLALEQGQKYYFEVLHKAGSGAADNLAVGWSKPGEATDAPGEVIPGYVLTPYVPPTAGSTPGTLYVSTMLSQNGATTSGVGNSTLRLSEDENTAYMTRTYSGLTGPITSEHIHVDPYLTHPSIIVFDIDTPVTSGDGLQPDGRYKWTILPVGTLTKADIVEIIKEGKAYINLHTAMYPNGEIRGNYTLANGTRTFTPPPAPPTFADDHTTNAGAVRFLTQATFGANIADIQALQGMAGYEAWIDDQFTKSPTQHLPEVLSHELADVFGSFDTRLSTNTWWKNSITGPDQLRQRIAFALSEIHVLSGQGPLEDNSLSISHFYDTLLTNCFGNFRDVLIGTTLTPGMGRYLDMLRNDKPDLTVGRTANENYAREIKQLFSIGLYRMWPDGTLMLSSQDTPIDTYSQREVVGLAHVFTGWDYGYDGDMHASFSAATNWMRPMRETPARHFTGTKRVLNNQVLPGLSSIGGQPLDPYATHTSAYFTDAAYRALPAQELAAVHDMLFNHPNVGPFICRQLIQRLVTSSPSRDYLYRVVQKFNDNGSGVRGDMKAVIKAILLDYEARSPDLITIPAYGKQREPILRVTAAARAFRPANVSGTYSQSGTNAITVTTSAAHLLQGGNNMMLEFTDTSGSSAPAAGTYAVASLINTTQYTVNAPGWLTGTYNQPSGSSVMTVTMNGHWLPAGGQAWFDFTSGAASGNAALDQKVLTVATSTAFDTPSGVGNISGSTFTITAPDTTARNGSVMISRFAGSYSCTGVGGTITIDTANGGTGTYGVMANHGLSVGDSVFLNFTNSRDTTSFNETSTENDLVYTVVSVPDLNTFTVTARNAANAAINSDDQVVVFPHKAQPLTRNGTINTLASTFTMDNTDLELAQTPLYSPTVFNFFLPDFKFSGALASQGITTPEFQLTAETSAVYQANFLYNGIFNPSASTTGISSFKTGTNSLVLNLSPWMANATDLGLGAGPQPTQVWTSNANVSTLIDHFNTLLLAGQLPAAAKTAIMNLLGGQIASISTGNPCTITMGGAHGLQTGDSVNITGVTGGTFSPTIINTFNITVPAGSTTTFTVPVNCTSLTSLGLTNSNAGIIPYTNATPSPTNMRDRLRNILHLLLTSPDYTIQR